MLFTTDTVGTTPTIMFGAVNWKEKFTTHIGKIFLYEAICTPPSNSTWKLN